MPDDLEKQVEACSHEVLDFANKLIQKYPRDMIAAAMVSQGTCGLLDGGMDLLGVISFVADTANVYEKEENQWQARKQQRQQLLRSRRRKGSGKSKPH